ncbi:hypothetical protein PDJAM_G00149770 [Pangasius djambal]|uniref:Uncharacterized protein n=1 Tax=Pangasius djambal TaxID=1691987 RepID=A0ACC5ZGZ0_9TELE|nr:hypothetical protein [Pangasius djambal]
MGGAKVLLVMLVIGLENVNCVNWNPVPRKTIRYHEVIDSMARFRAVGVFNYTMLTLSEHERVLYVGARETLFALDPNDITRQLRPQIDWPAPVEKKKECAERGKNNQTECFNYIRFLQGYNHTHMYTCGTYAFQPKCTYIVKPNFVGSALVRESRNSREGDDDKIYFFFSERAVELDCDGDLTVARVARVCKGDQGGTRTLQKKWTTFQKARLVCSLPERHITFNHLQAVFTMQGADWRNTVFYGVFHAQWGDVDVSAVCQYHIGEVKSVFEGPYKEYREASQRWGRYTGVVPNPRPGACITNFDRENGYNSSLQLPDATLNFAKKHPLMELRAEARPLMLTKGVNFTRIAVDRVNALDQRVYSVLFIGTARPLMLTKGVNFTRIAVDRVNALDQRVYSVLFIGTADGWLQRVAIVGSEAHVIEEIQLFDWPQPVDSLTISHSKKYLYIGSRSEVLQLPLANCSRYHSQPDCWLSRDPYCAWDSEGRACVRIDLHRGSMSTLTQDLMLERFNRGSKVKFDKLVSIPSPEHSRLRNVTVVVGSDLVLPCQLVSNLARPSWVLNDRELLLLSDSDTSGPRFDRALRALVIPRAGALQAGRYVCFSEEQGVKFQTERYQVAVVASAPVFMEPRAPDASMGLFWVLVIALGVTCLVLLAGALYLRRRLKLALGKAGTAEMKPLESTLVYPITLPKETPSFVPSKMPTSSNNDEDRFWETGANFYYSDGSLKIVPGHASSSSPSAIPGQPLHSPSRLSLTNIRNSGTNGYVRLSLSVAGEDRANGGMSAGGVGGVGGKLGIGPRENDYTSPFKEELRRTLQQRSVLPDANPEESSV